MGLTRISHQPMASRSAWRGIHRSLCSAQCSGYSQRPFFRAGTGSQPAEDPPLRHTAFFLVGAGPRPGPSHARAENRVFQPDNLPTSGKELKGNQFTGPSEVKDFLCEKWRLRCLKDSADNLGRGIDEAARYFPPRPPGAYARSAVSPPEASPDVRRGSLIGFGGVVGAQNRVRPQFHHFFPIVREILGKMLECKT